MALPLAPILFGTKAKAAVTSVVGGFGLGQFIDVSPDTPGSGIIDKVAFGAVGVAVVLLIMQVIDDDD